MKADFIGRNRTRIFILVFFVLTLLQAGLSQEKAIEKQARAYYKPESWPKTGVPLLRGMSLDSFDFKGFQLKEKRYFSPARGTNYIWYNEKEKLELWITIDVCPSVEAAHQELFDWLATGTSSLLRKGTLTDQQLKIGDVSWADPRFNTLAFSSRNVVVIILGRSTQPRHGQLMNEIALSIDGEIRARPGAEEAKRGVAQMAPIIEKIALEKPELRLNESTKVIIVARDPGGGKLEFSFHTTGGNILRTKEGILFQATSPGTHLIRVIVINTENIVSEKTISVTVTK